jgi:hypothetical protein
MTKNRFFTFYIIIFFLLAFGLGISLIISLGSDFYSAGAILLSAILALSGALINLIFQRRTARDANSLSFQHSLLNDSNYLTNVALSVKAFKNKHNVPLKELAQSHFSDSEEAKAIRYVLNTWERSANAMRHGIYDEKYLYEAHKSMVLHFGVILREFVNEKQKEQISFFENFSWLVLKWTIRRDSFEAKATKVQLKRVFRDLNRVKSGKLLKD